MGYRITGLKQSQFTHLFGLPEAELAKQNIQRIQATEPDTLPDRIEMRTLEIGETALLLNYEHLPVPSPYRSRHAIYVGENATRTYEADNVMPRILRTSPLSLRAFNAQGEIIDADLAQGDAVEDLITRLLTLQDTSYIHAHFARRGCYAGLITHDTAQGE